MSADLELLAIGSLLQDFFELDTVAWHDVSAAAAAAIALPPPPTAPLAVMTTIISPKREPNVAPPSPPHTSPTTKRLLAAPPAGCKAQLFKPRAIKKEHAPTKRRKRVPLEQQRLYDMRSALKKTLTRENLRAEAIALELWYFARLRIAATTGGAAWHRIASQRCSDALVRAQTLQAQAQSMKWSERQLVQIQAIVSGLEELLETHVASSSMSLARGPMVVPAEALAPVKFEW